MGSSSQDRMPGSDGFYSNQNAKTAAKSDDLLPCPFCGGKPKWVSGGPGCSYISCTECPAETGDGSVPRIKEAWNRRDDRIEQLEAELREARMQSIADLGQAQEAYEAQKKAEAERDDLRKTLEGIISLGGTMAPNLFAETVDRAARRALAQIQENDG